MPGARHDVWDVAPVQFWKLSEIVGRQKVKRPKEAGESGAGQAQHAHLVPFDGDLFGDGGVIPQKCVQRVMNFSVSLDDVGQFQILYVLDDGSFVRAEVLLTHPTCILEPEGIAFEF